MAGTGDRLAHQNDRERIKVRCADRVVAGRRPITDLSASNVTVSEVWHSVGWRYYQATKPPPGFLLEGGMEMEQDDAGGLGEDRSSCRNWMPSSILEDIKCQGRLVSVVALIRAR